MAVDFNPDKSEVMHFESTNDVRMYGRTAESHGALMNRETLSTSPEMFEDVSTGR